MKRSLNGMRVLVTGGCGFIGTNFVHHVMQKFKDVFVINLDALTYAGRRKNLAEWEGNERYQFVKGDICDESLVRDLIQACDCVLHLAAESHVDRSIVDARPFVQTNVLGTQVLLDAMREVDPPGDKRFVYVSTDEVYGELSLEAREKRFTEDMCLRPNSPYAASKAGADLMVQAYHRTYGMDTVVTRCGNNYGPYQYPEKLIPLFITNLLQNKPVPLYGDGKHVRDWVHVDDHVEALCCVTENGEAGEVYNVGAACERSNLELTKIILRAMGKPESMIEYVKDRAGHDRRYAIDARKIRENLGWKASVSDFTDKLDALIAWYTTHYG
ncbi:dTDP-glucose 4,6-dehydratase [Poriferisphaera sp. WC338]|uniref:dTDP-glucose 4,6-dehydratase n=1 Tax=Poriferisphaera sp. WC338 TaxID=3425129 RepID=UPI003D812BF3